jgi:hypothetical protein
LIAKSNKQRVVGKLTGNIHKVRDLGDRENGPSLADNKVKSHTKAGILSGELNGFAEGFTCHHQTCASQNAGLVSRDDGLIDGMGIAKVITVDDYSSLVSLGGSRKFIHHNLKVSVNKGRCMGGRLLGSPLTQIGKELTTFAKSSGQHLGIRNHLSNYRDDGLGAQIKASLHLFNRVFDLGT